MELSNEWKARVWFKGRAAGDRPNEWCKDACGAWIGWAYYGDRKSPYGWEIDHIDPNGGDGIANLQPLQWENNVAKSDSHRLICVKTSRGLENVNVIRR